MRSDGWSVRSDVIFRKVFKQKIPLILKSDLLNVAKHQISGLLKVLQSRYDLQISASVPWVVGETFFTLATMFPVIVF